MSEPRDVRIAELEDKCATLAAIIRQQGGELRATLRMASAQHARGRAEALFHALDIVRKSEAPWPPGEADAERTGYHTACDRISELLSLFASYAQEEIGISKERASDE